MSPDIIQFRWLLTKVIWSSGHYIFEYLNHFVYQKCHAQTVWENIARQAKKSMLQNLRNFKVQ